MLLFIPDQDQETGCPPGFPRLETHKNEAHHGDVCRNQKQDGFNVGWACPKECKVTQNRLAPYCKISSSNGAPCRVNKGTSYDYKYTK